MCFVYLCVRLSLHLNKPLRHRNHNGSLGWRPNRNPQVQHQRTAEWKNNSSLVQENNFLSLGLSTVSAPLAGDWTLLGSFQMLLSIKFKHESIFLMWSGYITKLFVMLLHYWAVEYSIRWDEIDHKHTSSVFLNVLFQVLSSAEDWVNHGTVPHHIHRSVCVCNWHQRWRIWWNLLSIFSSQSRWLRVFWVAWARLIHQCIRRRAQRLVIFRLPKYHKMKISYTRTCEQM